jgi:uncharacterized membrane protein YgcG
LRPVPLSVLRFVHLKRWYVFSRFERTPLDSRQMSTKKETKQPIHIEFDVEDDVGWEIVDGVWGSGSGSDQDNDDEDESGDEKPTLQGNSINPYVGLQCVMAVVTFLSPLLWHLMVVCVSADLYNGKYLDDDDNDDDYEGQEGSGSDNDESGSGGDDNGSEEGDGSDSGSDEGEGSDGEGGSGSGSESGSGSDGDDGEEDEDAPTTKKRKAEVHADADNGAVPETVFRKLSKQ